MITGGIRSGKSVYAERLALKLSTTPVYIATAHIWDEEFAHRVKRHQLRRGTEWTTIEEEKELSRHDINGKVALIDCVTMWCNNFFYTMDDDADNAFVAIKNEFDKFIKQDAILIFVTNEIGLGGISVNETQRHFADLQGWVNQLIATNADEVILMVSGIPVTIKSNTK